jgi:hypothetical protein
MNNHIRPVLLGYIRADLLRAESDLPVAKAYLEAFAEAEEYALRTIFVEQGHSKTDAFDALIDEMRRSEDAWGVVVPDVLHLADAERRVMRRHREDRAGMSLLVANFSP